MPVYPNWIDSFPTAWESRYYKHSQVQQCQCPRMPIHWMQIECRFFCLSLPEKMMALYHFVCAHCTDTELHNDTLECPDLQHMSGILGPCYKIPWEDVGVYSHILGQGGLSACNNIMHHLFVKYFFCKISKLPLIVQAYGEHPTIGVQFWPPQTTWHGHQSWGKFPALRIQSTTVQTRQIPIIVAVLHRTAGLPS